MQREKKWAGLLPGRASSRIPTPWQPLKNWYLLTQGHALSVYTECFVTCVYCLDVCYRHPSTSERLTGRQYSLCDVYKLPRTAVSHAALLASSSNECAYILRRRCAFKMRDCQQGRDARVIRPVGIEKDTRLYSAAMFRTLMGRKSQGEFRNMSRPSPESSSSWSDQMLMQTGSVFLIGWRRTRWDIGHAVPWSYPACGAAPARHH